jgi:hypothetical protein
MIAYKFSVSSGNSAATLVYTKTGDGTRADVSESQLPLATPEQREAVADIPAEPGKKRGPVRTKGPSSVQ